MKTPSAMTQEGRPWNALSKEHEARMTRGTKLHGVTCSMAASGRDARKTWRHEPLVATVETAIRTPKPLEKTATLCPIKFQVMARILLQALLKKLAPNNIHCYTLD